MLQINQLPDGMIPYSSILPVQKHAPGDEILVLRDLTNKGPLQKHYFTNSASIRFGYSPALQGL